MLHGRWERADERRVDELARVASAARRLDEHDPPRAEGAREPGGDRVAGHVPRVGQWVRRLEPAIRCEHRQLPGRERRGDGLALLDQRGSRRAGGRSEEHTSELQSLAYLVCRLLLEKKK